ncbi:uncharacterized protein LOC130664436 [Microplitis mediator]|uniref:uncharacterized protein LOC130664436 n=1 Tax=Microplitis mediator TaxID=375433 RepID=UPI0025533B10|nr:uncharacterized protein LOC130664436 [Microplitis mediator]
MLSLDEIALKIRVILPAGSNKVKGFVDYGNGDRHPDIADHVLVFMMRTLGNRKKQPLSYYFVHKTTPTKILKDLILKNIKDIERTGFLVVGVVSDQGSTKKAALCARRSENSNINNTLLNTYILFDDIARKIHILSDIVHILKTTRNNICGDVDSWLRKQPDGQKNKLLYPGNCIKWGWENRILAAHC